MAKPTVIPKEVQAEAIRLRSSGMSYLKIVAELKDQGVTERWVKNNLKDVIMYKESTVEDKVISEILKLATRKIGVKPSEVSEVYYEHYGTTWDMKKDRSVLDITSKEKDAIKRKVRSLAKKEGKTVMFISEWIQREHTDECKGVLFDCTQRLHEALTDIYYMYNETFPENKGREVSSFIYDVCSLNIPAMNPSRDVHGRFDKITDNLDTLKVVVKQKEVKRKIFDKVEGDDEIDKNAY